MNFEGIDLQKALDLSEEVYSKHLPGYTIGKGNTKSPFHRDSLPSFSVKFYNGKYRWKDFGTGEGGDIIDFIRKVYNLDFNSAVQKIVKDFDNNEPLRKVDSHCLKNVSKKNTKSVELDCKSRLFLKKELDWWKEFGISDKTLEKYNVSAVEYLFFNKTPVKCKTSTYCFKEFKNGTSIKIYSPFTPENKWYSNHKSEVLQGWENLPKTGDLLIIQKSLKDVMLMNELGYNSVAPQSETSFIKKNVLEQLLKRFKRVVIFWDNDTTGLQEAQKWAEKYQLEYIYIPVGEPKDISDYYFKYKEEQTKQLLNELIGTIK